MRFNGLCIACGRSNKEDNVPLSLIDVTLKTEACIILQGASAAQSYSCNGRWQPETQREIIK